jgi:hypothetical protein
MDEQFTEFFCLGISFQTWWKNLASQFVSQLLEHSINLVLNLFVERQRKCYLRP